MKLNKLLPIATVASIAGITIPLVSCSCGNKAIEYEITAINYVIGEPKTAGSMKESEATQIYFDDIYNNNKIFADDLAYRLLNGTNSGESIFVTVKSVNKKNHVLSFKYRIIGEELEMSNELINFPYEIIHGAPNGFANSWTFRSTLQTLEDYKSNSSWSFKYWASHDGQEQKMDINHNSTDVEIEKIVINQMKSIAEFQSHYLSSMTKSN